MEHPTEANPKPLVITIDGSGATLKKLIITGGGGNKSTNTQSGARQVCRLIICPSGHGITLEELKIPKAIDMANALRGVAFNWWGITNYASSEKGAVIFDIEVELGQKCS